MIKDVEYFFFKCFLALWYYLVENSLLSFVPHFLMSLFEFLEFNFFISLYILDISPLSDLILVKIFSQSVSCLFFVLLTVSAIVNKTAWYWYSDRLADQWNRIEDPEMNPHTYDLLIFNNIANNNPANQ